MNKLQRRQISHKKYPSNTSTLVTSLTILLLYFETTTAGAPIRGTLNTGELISLLSDIKDAFDEFQVGIQIVNDAMIGKPISAGTAWAKLAKRFDEATEKVNQIDTLFEIPGPAAELYLYVNMNNCETREQAFHVLKSQLEEARSARDREAKLLAKMEESLNYVERVYRAVTKLIKSHQLLINPLTGPQFEVLYIDLIFNMEPSTEKLKEALSSTIEQFKSHLTRLETYISTREDFQARAPQKCSPVRGSWTGKIQSNLKFPIRIPCAKGPTIENLKLSVRIGEFGDIVYANLIGEVTNEYSNNCPTKQRRTIFYEYIRHGWSLERSIFIPLTPRYETILLDAATFQGTVLGGRLKGVLTLQGHSSPDKAINHREWMLELEVM